MSPYAVQKLAAEWYCRIFPKLYGLETVSLRYFNVYGEGMRVDDAYSPCIAIFQKQKAESKPLTVYGGKQTRDYVYVGDVVEANILAATSDKVGQGEVINIGSGKNISIEDLAKMVSDNIEYLPQRKGEPMDTLADITKAKELLGWRPTMKLEDWL